MRRAGGGRGRMGTVAWMPETTATERSFSAVLSLTAEM